MSEEIREAVQIIEVAYDGIEIAMKVGSGGIAAMQKAIDFLKGMLDYEKSLGRTSMRKLLMKGGDLQVLEFAMEHYKKLKADGENVYIDKLTYEEFMMIGDKELGWRFQMLDEQEQKDRFNAEQGQELEYSEESETTDKRKELPKIDGKDTILRRMAQWEFSDEQQEEAQKAMIVGVPENKILEYFYPDVEVEEMRQVRENFEKASA